MQTDQIDFSNIGTQSICGAAPSGQDVREEEDFLLLQDEIDKLNKPASQSKINWEEVTRLATLLLTTKGKDLLVVSYLTIAELQNHGLPGLDSGLKILVGMLQAYWPSLYPPIKKMRARQNALHWLIERVQVYFEQNDWRNWDEQDPALITGLLKSVSLIESTLEKNDPDPVSFGVLITLFKALPQGAASQLAQVVPEPAPSMDSEPQPPVASNWAASPAPETAARPQPSPAIAITDSADAESIMSALSQYADKLREDLTLAASYRLNRVAAWSLIEALPPSQAGTTPIAPPPDPLVRALQQLESEHADLDLIRFCETQLANYPFWLDLNRYAHHALLRQSPAYQAAAHALQLSCAELITRLTGLEKLNFSNNRPFADAATQNWLDSLSSGGAQALEPAAIARPISAPVLTSKRRERLLQHIQRCQRQLEQTPPPALATAFALAIIADIDHFQLEEWEPGLAWQGLSIAWQMVKRIGDPKGLGDQLKVRLINLDPEGAITQYG